MNTSSFKSLNKLNNIDNNFFNRLNYLYKLNFKEFSHIANLIRPPEKIIESQKKYLNDIIKDIDKIFLNKKDNYIKELKKLTLLLGKLLAFSMQETIATCLYFEVNPFNQPAVEQGKILTKKYLV